MSQAIPIAITTFSGSPVTAAGDVSLSEVIKKDLETSGQFRIITDPAVSNTTNWRERGADYILEGHIANLGENQYQITVQLQSAFRSEDGSMPYLFKKVFHAPKADLRQLGHTISNLVYEQLTGVKGIFNTKIAYVLKQWSSNTKPIYALEVSDADGFNPQSLLVSPQPIMSPTWSPDGSGIAYVSFENHHASIFLQNVRTGTRRLISSFEGINGAPAFSPDGKKMALVLTKTDNPKIYLMDLDTLKLTQLTNGFSIDTEPKWSADGRTLIFTSDRGGSPQIYQYDFTNGKITRMTFEGNYNARASLLAGGNALVMMHRENSEFGIAKQDLTSGKVQILTNAGRDESPKSCAQWQNGVICYTISGTWSFSSCFN